MYRISVKIERVPDPRYVSNRSGRTEEPVPDLMVQATGTYLVDSIEKAMRVLRGEHESIVPDAARVKAVDPEDGPDEEDDDL